jgi:hypothetical protein
MSRPSPLPWDIIKAKKEVRFEFDRETLRLLRLKPSELDQIGQDEGSSTLTKIIAKELLLSSVTGLSKSLERILNRVLGKPVDQIALAVQDTQELAKRMLDLPKADQIKLIETRLAELKAEVNE